MMLGRYARLYNLIQFFDEESLLPPPFTLLTLFMYLITWITKSNCWQKGIQLLKLNLSLLLLRVFNLIIVLACFYCYYCGLIMFC
jgi:hypothetical protein